MAGANDDGVFGARPVKPIAHTVGENVDALSVGELDARIALLHAEIERLRQARAAREASRLMAEQAFRR